MNRIWFAISIMIFLFCAYILHTTFNMMYGSLSYEMRLDKRVWLTSAEALVLGILFYFRAKDALLSNKDKIAGYLALGLAALGGLAFMLVPIIGGLVFKSRTVDNTSQVKDQVKADKFKRSNIKLYFQFLLFSIAVSIPAYFILGISLNVLSNFVYFEYPTASIIYIIALIISVPLAHLLFVKDIETKTVVEYVDKTTETKPNKKQ